MACEIAVENMNTNVSKSFTWDNSECKAMDYISYYKLEWLWNFIYEAIRTGFDAITEQAWEVLSADQKNTIIDAEGLVGSIKQLSRKTKEDIIKQTPFMRGAESYSINITENGLPVPVLRVSLSALPIIEISQVEFAAMKKNIIKDILEYLRFRHGQKLIEFMKTNPNAQVEETIKKFNNIEPMLGSQSTWLFWWIRNKAIVRADIAINEMIVESVNRKDALTGLDRNAIAAQIRSPFLNPQKLDQMPIAIRKDICGLSKLQSGKERTDIAEAI